MSHLWFTLANKSCSNDIQGVAAYSSSYTSQSSIHEMRLCAGKSNDFQHLLSMETELKAFFYNK